MPNIGTSNLDVVRHRFNGQCPFPRQMPKTKLAWAQTMVSQHFPDIQRDLLLFKESAEGATGGHQRRVLEDIHTHAYCGPDELLEGSKEGSS